MNCNRAYSKTLEQAMGYTNFSSMRFTHLYSNRNSEIFSVERRQTVSWVLKLSPEEYERFGKPEEITGKEIYEHMGISIKLSIFDNV